MAIVGDAKPPALIEINRRVPPGPRPRVAAIQPRSSSEPPQPDRLRRCGRARNQESEDADRVPEPVDIRDDRHAFPAKEIFDPELEVLPHCSWLWWQGQDIDVRQTLGLTTAAEAEQEVQHRQDDRALLLAALRDQQLIGDEWEPEDLEALSVAIERFLARSPSALMMANLSDMLGEAAQINVPGTVSEHPNWRHRLPLPVSALATNPLVRRIAEAVTRERDENIAPAH